MKSALKLTLVALLLVSIGCSGREADFSRSLAVRSAADMVLRGGKIVTVDGAFSIKQAVAIKDGRFVAVGSDGEIRDYIGQGTRVIDLLGRTVIPGLIDSHIHATVAGLSWDAELHWQLNRTLADGLRQIATAAQEQSAGELDRGRRRLGADAVCREAFPDAGRARRPRAEPSRVHPISPPGRVAQ